MPRWSALDLAAYQARRSLPGAVAQPAIRHDALEAPQRTQAHSKRRVVRITSRRRRLLDPDNLAPKYHIDALRYAGIIRDDSPADIELVVRQEKVRTKAEEFTVIEIDQPNEADP